MRYSKSFFKAPLLITLFVTCMTFPTTLTSQYSSYRGYEHWYIGLNLGSTHFYGDISGKDNSFANTNPFSGDFYNDRKFMYGLMLTKRFSGYFWMRANLLTGTLGSERESLDLYFKSDIMEFSATGMLNFMEIINGDDPQRNFNAYAFMGAGLVSFRAWKRQLVTDSLIATEGTGKRKATDLIIPMGLGVDYRVTDQFNISGEFTLRSIPSDRIDAHTDNHRLREGYGYINLGLHYHFDMPDGFSRKASRYNGKSTDPAIRAYNKDKATIMKTKGYQKSMRDKRRLERERKEWLILQFFKKTRLDMATE